MVKVAKGARKRAYKPKTRTGCITCKSKNHWTMLVRLIKDKWTTNNADIVRRVKCDEARPACIRCTSTGRTCDGYTTTDVPTGIESFSSPERMTVALRPGPCVELFDSVQSKRSFAFFRRRTSPQLSGFFKSEFWESLVFRVAHHESAVRHAIVALGAVHEAIEHRASSPTAIQTFAMEQYNLAIRELLVPLTQRGERAVDVCLISCIIFANFEVSLITVPPPIRNISYSSARTDGHTC